jgi:hypothetical protein
MKRDMDSIRLILFDAEAEEEVDLGGYSREEIGYHNWLIIDAGLAKGADVTGMGDSHPQWVIRKLNWAGHDFLDAARSDTVWHKAQTTIEGKGCHGHL